jgi:hypothetical protein
VPSVRIYAAFALIDSCVDLVSSIGSAVDVTCKPYAMDALQLSNMATGTTMLSMSANSGER